MSDYSLGMERICGQCHAVVGFEFAGDWCPACGGALVARAELAAGLAQAAAEVDQRGIVLPKRHALGGIITPQ